MRCEAIAPARDATKTGTSSDFRDTWTAGFTTDYTVATWIGNFDGAPMRRVSGVTGAAPLWNRIMRRLAERAQPPAFATPAGYVRRAICATTGVRPTRDCSTVVREEVFGPVLAARRRVTRGRREVVIPADRGVSGINCGPDGISSMGYASHPMAGKAANDLVTLPAYMAVANALMK